VGRKVVPSVAERTDPNPRIEVHTAVCIEYGRTGLAVDRLVWNHLRSGLIRGYLVDWSRLTGIDGRGMFGE